jgi:hypothetical protein
VQHQHFEPGLGLELNSFGATAKPVPLKIGNEDWLNI